MEEFIQKLFFFEEILDKSNVIVTHRNCIIIQDLRNLVKKKIHLLNLILAKVLDVVLGKQNFNFDEKFIFILVNNILVLLLLLLNNDRIFEGVNVFFKVEVFFVNLVQKFIFTLNFTFLRDAFGRNIDDFVVGLFLENKLFLLDILIKNFNLFFFVVLNMVLLFENIARHVQFLVIVEKVTQYFIEIKL